MPTCADKTHHAFPVVNVNGRYLCATCWYRHDREIIWKGDESL